MNSDEIEKIEKHQLPDTKSIYWRNSNLNFRNPEKLIASLELRPEKKNLLRTNDSLDGEVKKILKDKVDITEYRISEIEVERKLNQSPKDVILNIQEKIDQLGFETAALNYSIASSSSNKGDLGWINSKSLSRKFFNVISKMNINDISSPIQKQNVVIFLNKLHK